MKVAEFSLEFEFCQNTVNHKYQVFSSKHFKNSTLSGNPNYMTPKILKNYKKFQEFCIMWKSIFYDS